MMLDRRLSLALLGCLGLSPRSAVGGPPPPDASEIEWAGSPGPARPEGGPTLAVIGKDDLVRFVPAQGRRPARLQRVRFHRQLLWDRPLPGDLGDAATVLADAGGGAVYLARYSAIASGAAIRAFDLGSGAERWAARVRGLGPIAHSQYANHVVLKRMRGGLVVFGNEAGGRYIEVFDAASGRMLSTRVLPMAQP